jgi:putative chitinase
MIRLDQLERMIPNAKDKEVWLENLNLILPEFEIDTPERIGAFMGQCGHESQDFSILVENLNYSWQALRKVWPRHFPSDEIAQQYHRQPQKIANRAYANRMGNGPEESGDGWKYRGRGIIQITGFENYRRCSNDLFSNQVFVEEPELLTDFKFSIYSACWFWKMRKINQDADMMDDEAITKKINGGLHGIDDRIRRSNNCRGILRR